MKVRTVTVGFNLKQPLKERQVEEIVDFANSARHVFEIEGYEVQTLRIATQPWELYCQDEGVVQIAKDLESIACPKGIDYISLGTAKIPKNMPLIYKIISNTSACYCTTYLSDGNSINYEAARETATLVKKLSLLDDDGFTNRRFSALFNVGPGSPFFPAAYHAGPDSFAIGTENSDLVFKAFSSVKDISKASKALLELMETEYSKLEKTAEKVGKTGKIPYCGIDASVATSVAPDESIAFAFEHLGLGEFGDPGTLAAAKVVTDVLQKLSIKKCGYSGLMLPLLEDYGLATRNDEGKFNISNLLLYSAVCGTGLDTIPIPGDAPENKIYALLLDIASLSTKLKKPLSARLMPARGKRAGEMTNYDFEYFVNTKIMPL